VQSAITGRGSSRAVMCELTFDETVGKQNEDEDDVTEVVRVTTREEPA